MITTDVMNIIRDFSQLIFNGLLQLKHFISLVSLLERFAPLDCTYIDVLMKSKIGSQFDANRAFGHCRSDKNIL
jgi:hypothetical protein